MAIDLEKLKTLADRGLVDRSYYDRAVEKYGGTEPILTPDPNPMPDPATGFQAPPPTLPLPGCS